MEVDDAPALSPQAERLLRVRQQWAAGVAAELDSDDPMRQLAALRAAKNGVIGNRSRKAALAAAGVVPRLVQLLRTPGAADELRLQAVATLGSFAIGRRPLLRRRLRLLVRASSALIGRCARAASASR